MSEGDDLYRAVLDSPEDDAPRLIYADWLDEHGRPDRAEFIRLQCAMDRIPPGTARWKPLFERCQRLEREGRATWTGPAQERVLETRLRRGFVDWVRLTIDQFVHFAEELVRLEPIRVWSFSEVALFGRRPSFTKLAANPYLTVMRGLDAGRFLPDELVRTLATSNTCPSCGHSSFPTATRSPMPSPPCSAGPGSWTSWRWRTRTWLT